MFVHSEEKEILLFQIALLTNEMRMICHFLLSFTVIAFYAFIRIGYLICDLR